MKELKIHRLKTIGGKTYASRKARKPKNKTKQRHNEKQDQLSRIITMGIKRNKRSNAKRLLSEAR